MLKILVKGDYKPTRSYLKKVKNFNITSFLQQCGMDGVRALQQATPKDTGKTAESWHYEINKKNNNITLSWHNDNTSNNIPIVILLQYGHVTINGSFVEGRDFINPALEPIFNKIVKTVGQYIAKP